MIIIEILWIPFSLLIGFILLWIFYSLLTMGDNEEHRKQNEYTHREVDKPIHRFSNDEILSPGIDVRRASHRQELLDRRSIEKRQQRTIEKAEKIIKRK